MFANRKVLVTGGAGFIGSHLVERLVAGGARVTIADIDANLALGNLHAVRDRITYSKLDLVVDDVSAFMAMEQYDVAFHLAASAHVATSVDNPRRDFERNAVATLNLMEAVRKVSPGTAVIYTSSAVVYRGGGSELIREDDPTVPGSPYGVSKLTAERYVNVYARMYGLKTAVLRLFSVFGPRLRKQIVYDLMCRLRDDPQTLVLRGTGKEMRDFSYVENVVDALLLVAQSAPMEGEAYNVASGEPIAIGALARLIATLMGLSPELRFSGDTTSGDTSHWFADTARLKSLGHVPVVGLAEGLKRTLEWSL